MKRPTEEQLAEIRSFIDWYNIDYPYDVALKTLLDAYECAEAARRRISNNEDTHSIDGQGDATCIACHAHTGHEADCWFAEDTEK